MLKMRQLKLFKNFRICLQIHTFVRLIIPSGFFYYYKSTFFISYVIHFYALPFSVFLIHFPVSEYCSRFRHFSINWWLIYFSFLSEYNNRQMPNHWFHEDFVQRISSKFHTLICIRRYWNLALSLFSVFQIRLMNSKVTLDGLFFSNTSISQNIFRINFFQFL